MNEKNVSRWSDVEDDVVECDEYALHDITCTMNHLEFECNDDAEGIDVVNKIKLTKTGEMSEEDREILERKFNELLKHMRDVDSYLHNVATYTC